MALTSTGPNPRGHATPDLALLLVLAHRAAGQPRRDSDPTRVRLMDGRAVMSGR